MAGTFPSRGVWRRPSLRPVDVIVFAALLALLFGVLRLLEILAVRGGTDGLAELADELNFEVDDLLPLVDAAVLLGLAEVPGADLEITDRSEEHTSELQSR